MSKLGSLTPSLLNERRQSYNSTHFISSTPLWFYSCQTPGLATSTWAPSPYPQVAPSCQQTLVRCSTPKYGVRQSSLMAMLSSGFQTSQVECRRWAQKRSAQIVTAECWTPLTLMSVPPKRKIRNSKKYKRRPPSLQFALLPGWWWGHLPPPIRSHHLLQGPVVSHLVF